MSHICSTALVRCMDFRLESAIQDFLKERNLINNVDIISVAGAAKDIAQEEDSYTEAMVYLSHNLHKTQKVILMNHTDCGAYGGHSAFDSIEAEIAVYEKDLRAAKKKILAKYPEIEVELILGVMEEDSSIHMETVA